MDILCYFDIMVHNIWPCVDLVFVVCCFKMFSAFEFVLMLFVVLYCMSVNFLPNFYIAV